jgi:putative transposase
MARRPRLLIPGAAYHVMARGNRKYTIFHDVLDHERFLWVIERAVRFYSLRIFALCLMPNHYHLVLDTPRNNLSSAMQYINGVFAQISNKRYDRTGHVFGDRFRSLVIQREGYLKRAARYTVRNPVRAKIVEGAGQWRWSSYRATAGLDSVPSWLNMEWLLWSFKADSLEEAQRRYIVYVNESGRADKSRDPRVDVYGSDKFKAEIAAILLERRDERPLPWMSPATIRAPLDRLFADVDSRVRRDDAIRKARIEHGYRVAEIARFLAIHPSTICRAVQRG